MAKTGLSKAYYAKYAAEGTSVTYSAGGTLGKAVDADISLDNADAVIFYADNGPAESAQQFSGGTLTITNDRMPMAPIAAVLGLTTVATSSPSGTTVDFPASLTPPYVGYGTIIRNVEDNTQKWLAIILPKVQFQIPTDTATTGGDTIEFSGYQLTAKILRDDTANGNWKKYGLFSSEADAESWIKTFLSIT